MKTLTVISSAILMLFFVCSAAQTKPAKTPISNAMQITGTAKDNSGLPLPGVSVSIKGTRKATTTDFDGRYSIKASKGNILRFTYIGFKSLEVKVKTSYTINVTLEEDSNELQEVVINTGYRTENVRTFSTSSVPMADKAIITSNAMVARANSGTIRKDLLIAPAGYVGNSESYTDAGENPFESPQLAPLSTFSIDTDNASYTNIRRMINNGQKVPVEAVRIEEMINFFTYTYPQPKENDPFSINSEVASCPWNPDHRLLRIGLQGRNIPTDKLPASNFVFLIDVSGSMNADNKLPLLKESLRILLGELRPQDKVGIVVYAGAAGTVLEPTSAKNKEKIGKALSGLSAGGSTAGGAGIQLAYKLAEEHFIKGGNNRVILATDGDFNVGSSSDKDMQQLIEEKRQSGIFLTCLGFGMGNYKDSKMEVLANKGNGNYAYIDNIQEAKRFLGKEFKGSMYAIAKDVKFQIEFNPKHVQAYRLIGYENRKLRAEDFVNDKIDAGELGSGHTVTALYEVIPTGVKSDFYNGVSGLKYSKTELPTGYTDELATIKLRFKKPDDDNSAELSVNIPNSIAASASDDFKFCASVAWFGLRLRDSELAKNKTAADITVLAKNGLRNDSEGYRAEFIRLVGVQL